ncbi:hypothetical protein niasHS_011105 [Heterodera schachtii]|uniref:Rhodanese domain-containing protein n=1 Tax=Heterodera schachtii TaxID=97005 RepID=A0ABD2J3V3_HETSC
MFSAKSQRRAWAPRAVLNNGTSKNGTNFGDRRSLPVNTSFRGTYSWGPTNGKAKNANGKESNGSDTLPIGDNSPKEAYCTVEEIQLGKRHSKSPIMDNGMGTTRRIQWKQKTEEGEGKSEQGQDELEENHYEDGDEGEERNSGSSSSREQAEGGGRHGKGTAQMAKALPPRVPPLPPPLPPPKLFGNGKSEMKPRAKSNLTRFWPALAFLAFCLILLSIAFLSLWVANNNSEKRHKSQINWPLRLVPVPKPSSTTSATTPKGRGKLIAQREEENEDEGTDEDGEEEGAEKGALASEESDQQSKGATARPMPSETPAPPEGTTALGGDQQQNAVESCSQILCSSAKENDHQFVAQPEEFVRWIADGQMRKRLRLFEVRERNSHPPTPVALPSAKVLLLSSLSHNGVPVHPLQFQRLLRSEEVDHGSVVLLYDVQSSQQLWAHYAIWIFRLFGLDRSLLLMGGPNWSVNGTSLAKLLEGVPFSPANALPPGHLSSVGTFRAQWRAEFITTFDDVLANFEKESTNAKADIVDAQTDKEFHGRAPLVSSAISPSAIFGHIRGAQSVPVESLAGLSPEAQSTLFFAQFGLSRARPVIVYDGFSSHRAAFVWMALQRANFSAELYFGAWPEWLVRAPDHLKVIPDN